MSAIPNQRGNPAGTVLDTHMSMQAAAEYSGYNVQYLRRIVRAGIIDGVKVGPV